MCPSGGCTGSDLDVFASAGMSIGPGGDVVDQAVDGDPRTGEAVVLGHFLPRVLRLVHHRRHGGAE